MPVEANHFTQVASETKKPTKKEKNRQRKRIERVVSQLRKPRGDPDTDPSQSRRRWRRPDRVQRPRTETPPAAVQQPEGAIELETNLGKIRFTKYPQLAPGITSDPQAVGDETVYGPDKSPREKIAHEVYIDKARERARVRAALERQDVANLKSPWFVYGTSPRTHQMRIAKYGNLLTKDVRDSEMSFDKLDQECPEGDGPNLVMDAMGQGSFVGDYRGAHHEADVTLVDLRPEEDKSKDRAAGKEVIPGDIFDPLTRRKVREFIDTYDNVSDPKDRGMAVVTCIPKGGWGTVQGAADTDMSLEDLVAYEAQSTQAEWDIANWLYQTLRPGGKRPAGTLYFETSGMGNYDEWLDELQKNPGIHAVLDDNVNYGFHYLRISKVTGETENLPSLPPRHKPPKAN